MKEYPDQVFSENSGRKLRLDLFVPEVDSPPPLVVVIHGGGWREGSRKDEGLEWLGLDGFAFARIEYRYSHEARFPAQLDDCKAALQWLKHQAKHFGYDSRQPSAIGTSAGGTLALLLGIHNLVASVVSYCAACDLPLRSLSQPELTEKPGGLVYDLLGGSPSTRQDLARQASPVHMTHRGAAPCLLFQGTHDRQVLADQPLSLLQAGLREGADISVVSVPKGGHCSPEYHNPRYRAQVTAFLKAVNPS